MGELIFFIIVCLLFAYVFYTWREKKSINKHKKNQNYSSRLEREERDKDNPNI